MSYGLEKVQNLNLENAQNKSSLLNNISIFLYFETFIFHFLSDPDEDMMVERLAETMVKKKRY